MIPIHLNNVLLVSKTRGILFYLFLIIVFNSNISLSQSTDLDKDINYFQIGFSSNVFSGVYLNDAIAAAKVLTEFFLKKYNRTWEVKSPEIFSNIDELKKILSEQEFELLIMHPGEYIQVKDMNLLEPIGMSLRDGSPYDTYHLLVHKDSDIKNLSYLKDKKILIDLLGGDKARLWLDKLLKEKNLSRKEKFFTEIQFVDKPLSTVLPVFFRKIDACILNKSSYSTVVELNPQIGRDLISIEVSQPLAIGLIALRKTISDQQVKIDTEETMLNFHNYEESRQYLTVFKIGKVVEFKEEYLESTYALLEINK